MYKELVKQSLSIKLFASLRQAMNYDEIKIGIDNEITVLQMKEIIFKTFPNLKKSNIPFFVAVNHKYVNIYWFFCYCNQFNLHLPEESKLFHH